MQALAEVCIKMSAEGLRRRQPNSECLALKQEYYSRDEIDGVKNKML